MTQGWAPETLLDTYETERRPIAQRNTAFAGAMADSIGRLPVTPVVEETGSEADTAREELGAALAAHVASEFNTPGLQLGMRYISPIVVVEDSEPPPDTTARYVPSGYPGARAPHVRAGTGSLLDQFGRDFTLLAFGDTAVTGWERAAGRQSIPLTVVRSVDAGARELYGADLVLIRPDHHIAWRGNVETDPAATLARATGNLKGER